MELGCLKGNAKGCDRLSSYYLKNGEIQKGNAYLSKACDLGESKACAKSQLILEFEKKKTLPVVKAAHSSKKALTAPSPEKPPLEGGNSESEVCGGLPAALKNCSAYRCYVPHPSDQSQKILNEVTEKKESLCTFRQVAPNGQEIVCRLKDFEASSIARSMESGSSAVDWSVFLKNKTCVVSHQ